jgi:hypothetical protein
VRGSRSLAAHADLIRFQLQKKRCAYKRRTFKGRK